ncbi:MAG: hypothetical protein H0T95_11720 [Chthoniobacterales bacterium]|nr:hypothetical protein [Chthoniobacterales bacterium]
MVHPKRALLTPLVFAVSLLFAAWHLQQTERSIVGDVAVLALGVVMICVAIAYYRSAPQLSLFFEQRDPKRAFPAKWYSGNIRSIAVLGAALGILFLLLGIALVRSPLR